MTQEKTNGLPTSLSDLNRVKQELAIQELLLIKKGLESDNPNQIIQATKAAKDIQDRQTSNLKAYSIDPFDVNNGQGWQDKNTPISYETLFRMSHVPVIAAILTTRAEQLSQFAQPQPDKYHPGYVIRKKTNFHAQDQKKVTKADINKIDEITKFILNCGSATNQWHGDNFNKFLRKIIKDSLTYDAMTFEVVRNKRGIPVEFKAVDAKTIKVADSYDEDVFNKLTANSDLTEIKGYLPSHVQVLNGQIKSEFYPWELCYGIRNPTTDIENPNYGRSELEDLIYVVTGILWADQYNMNFFKNGAAPKGILKVAGNVNENTLAQFRQSWAQMISGVSNSFKTPIIEGDNVDFVNLQQSSKDMEFAHFQEYLLKLCCALYKIDPSEIGFNLSGGAGTKTTFESDGESKIKNSKDKGLRGLLIFIEEHINKFLVNAIDPEFEFKFVGLETETVNDELDSSIKRLAAYETLNDIRHKNNLPPVENGDIVLNPTFLQYLQMQQQQKQADQQAAAQSQQSEQGQDDGDNPFGGDKEGNPFTESDNE